MSAPETGLLLWIDGKPYNATDLTLDEVEEIENACGGVALEELDFARARVLKAVVFTLLKRDDPDVTMERVGRIRLRTLLREPEDPEVNGAATASTDASRV